MKRFIKDIETKLSLSYCFLSVAVGGFTTLYLINIFNIKWLPFLHKAIENKDVINNLKENGISGFYVLIFVISSVILIVAPLIKVNSSKFDLILSTIIVSSITLTIFELVISIAQNHQSTQLILLLWLLCSLTMMYIGRLVLLLYYWVQIGGENHYDIVKLTFIWGIIATVLTLLK